MKNIVINEKLIYLKEQLSKIKIRLVKYEIETDEVEKETLFAAITKFVEEAIETSIKINNILLEEKKDFASTYYQTFSKLSKHYNINKKELEEFAKFTSIRNKTTHDYENICENEKETVEKYKQFITIFPKYIKLINNL